MKQLKRISRYVKQAMIYNRVLLKIWNRTIKDYRQEKGGEVKSCKFEHLKLTAPNKFDLSWNL